MNLFFGNGISCYSLGIHFLRLNNFKKAKKYFYSLLSFNDTQSAILGNIGLGHYYFQKDNRNYSSMNSRNHFALAFNLGSSKAAYELALSLLHAAPPYQNLILGYPLMQLAANEGVPEAMGYVLRARPPISDS